MAVTLTARITGKEIYGLWMSASKTLELVGHKDCIKKLHVQVSVPNIIIGEQPEARGTRVACTVVRVRCHHETPGALFYFATAASSRSRDKKCDGPVMWWTEAAICQIGVASWGTEIKSTASRCMGRSCGFVTVELPLGLVTASESSRPF